MAITVLFIQGAGEVRAPDGSGVLAEYLRRELGDSFEVVAPEMPDADSDPRVGPAAPASSNRRVPLPSNTRRDAPGASAPVGGDHLTEPVGERHEDARVRKSEEQRDRHEREDDVDHQASRLARRRWSPERPGSVVCSGLEHLRHRRRVRASGVIARRSRRPWQRLTRSSD